MKRNIKGLVGIAMIVFFGSASLGCATLFNGNRGDLQVNSNPTGAKVFVDGVEYGMTPVKLHLDEKKAHVITLKDGQQERTLNISKKVGASWIILDVLGGLIPIIVDAATGSWYDVDPHELNVQI